MVAPADLPAAPRAAAATGFDLTTDLPVRVTLFRVDGATADYALVLVLHHIAADGLGPLVRDVLAAYTARVTGAAPQGAARGPVRATTRLGSTGLKI